MSRPKVTIDLDEYSKLLDESKKYNEGFLSTYTINFRYGFGGKDKIITTNEQPVKEMFALLEEKDNELQQISSDFKYLKEIVSKHNNLPLFKRFRRIKSKGEQL